MSSGLANVGLLKVVRLFPTQFEPLFIDQPRRVTSTTILQLLRFPQEMNDRQQSTAGMLRDFICSCSTEGIVLML